MVQPPAQLWQKSQTHPTYSPQEILPSCVHHRTFTVSGLMESSPTSQGIWEMQFLAVQTAGQQLSRSEEPAINMKNMHVKPLLWAVDSGGAKWSNI